MQQTKTVVVVEDEPDTVEMLAEMIHLMGYRVIKIYGGISAVDIIRNEKPDLVLLDLMMPDLSGLDILRILRGDPETENIPVVVVSAKSLPSDIRSGLAEGASYYLTKPVSYDEIKFAVNKAIGNS